MPPSALSLNLMHSDGSCFQGGGGEVSAVASHSVGSILLTSSTQPAPGSVRDRRPGLSQGPASQSVGFGHERRQQRASRSLFLPVGTAEAKGITQPGSRRVKALAQSWGCSPTLAQALLALPIRDSYPSAGSWPWGSRGRQWVRQQRC